MWNITIKELNSFFSSAAGYIVIIIFLLSTSLLLWVFPGNYNIVDMGYANVGGLFTLAPWLYLFLCPAVTMKMFAEEKQSGTMELLLTRPISPWKIICLFYFRPDGEYGYGCFLGLLVGARIPGNGVCVYRAFRLFT